MCILDAAFFSLCHLQCNPCCVLEDGCSLFLQTVGRMELLIRRMPIGSTCCTLELWERDSRLLGVWCTPTSDLGVTCHGSRTTGCHTCCAGLVEGGLELELRSGAILIESRWLSILERGVYLAVSAHFEAPCYSSRITSAFLSLWPRCNSLIGRPWLREWGGSGVVVFSCWSCISVRVTLVFYFACFTSRPAQGDRPVPPA